MTSITTPAPPATATVTVTSTSTPAPTPASASTAQGVGLGSWLGIVFSATVIAALITGSINTWLARSKSKAEERARIRNTFAEAFQAYADYKEMPYVVRRRDPEKPSEERLRLSSELRAIQSRLSYYETWITIEAPAVGEKFSEMIQQLRRVAGGAMRDAWNEEGVSADAGMNIPPSVVDLSSLASYETAYRVAVRAHLAARSRAD
jgi:hypothetical protein